MTSIAELRPAARGHRLRAFLLVVGLLAGASATPPPWSGLWLLVPAATATALLLAWRFGRLGFLLPLGLAVGAWFVDGAGSLWAWWVPAAAASGAWMGSREEHGVPAGARAWMLLPVLALAAALPWALPYHSWIGALDRDLRQSDAQLVTLLQQMGYGGERLAAFQRTLADNAKLRVDVLPNALPLILFVWVALLVAAGRALASRVAALLRWPPLRPGALRDWRLPDGALWTLIAGLALILAPWQRWEPSAWTVLLAAGLGFCVQGVAVVESLMLARGIPLSIVVLTMLFVLAMALQVFVVATAALGLSDVWLDFRRLEVARDRDEA